MKREKLGEKLVEKWRAQRAKSAKQQGLVSDGVVLGGFAPKTHGAWNFADSHLWHEARWVTLLLGKGQCV